MARRTPGLWQVWLGIAVTVIGAVWWFGQLDRELEMPDEDAPMSDDEERALMQEIGYLK
jgi:hypothetical protein